METGKETDQSIRIRGAFPDDLPFLRSMALEAFSIYGDYETISRLTNSAGEAVVYRIVAQAKTLESQKEYPRIIL